MEWNILTEHVEQGLGDVPVQTSEKTVEKLKKKRDPSDKAGINRYNQQLIRQTLAAVEGIKTELRWVRHRLEKIGEAVYDEPTVEGFAVQDQVDREILQRVREVGDAGVFPKDVAVWVNKLGAYGLKYYDVSRRIVRMNKRLHFETGKFLFEKRGHRWALTRFAFDAYGAVEKDWEVERAGASQAAEAEEEVS